MFLSLQQLLHPCQIRKVNHLIVGVDHCAHLGGLFLQRKVLCLLIEQAHHELVLDAEAAVVNSSAQVHKSRVLHHPRWQLSRHAFADVLSVLRISGVRKSNRSDDDLFMLPVGQISERLLKAQYAARIERADIGDSAIV